MAKRPKLIPINDEDSMAVEAVRQQVRNDEEGRMLTADELKTVYETASAISDDTGHGVTALAPYSVTSFESDQMFIDKAARAEREQRRFKTNFRKESGEFEICVGPVGSITPSYAKPSAEKNEPKTPAPSSMEMNTDYISQSADPEEDFFSALGTIAQHSSEINKHIEIDCSPKSHRISVRKTAEKD